MYLQIGEEKALFKKDIVGIFDLENTTIYKSTKEFLNKKEKEGKVINVSGALLPVSFLLTKEDFVYLSPVSSKTLKIRLKNQ